MTWVAPSGGQTKEGEVGGGGGGEETKRRLKGKWEVGGGLIWVAPNDGQTRRKGGWGGRGREREKVEGELIDKNFSSTSMGNLLGRGKKV